MLIIDVRTKGEYDMGHLNNALNIDLGDLMGGKLPDVEKKEQIILYCVSGGRASRAQQILEIAGFTNVENGGGYLDLKLKGY